MTVILKNNASGFLATSISATDTSIILSTGTGANFPTLGAGDYFYATFSPTSGASEIVKCTARSGDTLTVVRAQEGTSALSFAAGSRVELRVTAQSVIDAITDRVSQYDQASEITIVDAGSYYSSGNVEGALQEAAVFTQIGTGATAQPQNTKMQRTYSVTDFMTPAQIASIRAGTPVDVTAAIQACFAALQQTNDDFTITVNGVPRNYNIGCTGTVYFPKGNYRISDTIRVGAYTRVIGEYATLRCTDNTKDIFRVYGFETHIEGISFAGGKRAIYFDHGNVNTSIASVTNCTFNAQNDYSIASPGAFSTKLNISNCKFVCIAGALFNECDECTFETSWIEALAPNIAYVKNHGSMTARDLILVPDTNGTAAEALTTYWFQNGNSTTFQGGFTYMERVRFGGESGGFASAVNYAVPAPYSSIHRGLIFQACGMWGGNSIVRLAKVPDFVIARATDFSNGGYPRLIVDENLSTHTNSPYIDIDFDADQTNAVLKHPIRGRDLTGKVSGSAVNNLLGPITGYFDAPGYVAAGNLGTGGASTLTAETPPFDYHIVSTFGSDNGSQLYSSYAYPSPLAGQPVGWYTAGVLIKATKPVVLSLGQAGQGGQGRYQVPGDNQYHIVSHQFFHPGGNNGLAFALYQVRTDGVVVTWGSPRLVSGYVTDMSPFFWGGSPTGATVKSLNGLLYAANPPTGGSENARGMVVFNESPTAGGPIGWVNTARANPGTWVPFGPLQIPNAYTVSNGSTDRALDVTGDTLAQVAAVLGTLITDLKTAKVLT